MTDGDQSPEEREAQARKREREDRKAALAWAGTLGMVGWMVTLPAVLGILLGRALDLRLGSGRVLTIALLLAGIVLGCGSAWRWIKRRLEDEKKTG